MGAPLTSWLHARELSSSLRRTDISHVVRASADEFLPSQFDCFQNEMRSEHTYDACHVYTKSHIQYDKSSAPSSAPRAVGTSRSPHRRTWGSQNPCYSFGEAVQGHGHSQRVLRMRGTPHRGSPSLPRAALREDAPRGMTAPGCPCVTANPWGSHGLRPASSEDRWGQMAGCDISSFLRTSRWGANFTA